MTEPEREGLLSTKSVPGAAEAKQVLDRGGYTPENVRTFEAINESLQREQGDVVPVSIDYESVKETRERKPGEPLDAKERAKDQEAAYIAEAMADVPPDIRATFEKQTVPVRWIVRGENVNLLAMSPDKVLANAHRIAGKAGEANADLVPYQTRGGKITAEGWKQFTDDLGVYTRNQANGYAGDGSPVVRPEDYSGVVPEQNPNYQPTPLDKTRADFINAAMALPPPKTNRGGGAAATVPNIEAAKLASANRRPVITPARTSEAGKNVYVRPQGQFPIAETNPLRDAFAQRGIDLTGRELFQATEELDLQRIKNPEVQAQSRFRAPSTDLVRAGFMPDPTDPAQFGAKLKGSEPIRAVEESYVRSAGLNRTPFSGYVPVNEALAKRFADAYEAAADSPDAPEVRKAYEALARETRAQWDALTAAGYKMEPWTGKGEPYKNSADMVRDMEDNKHLWFFATDNGFGTLSEANANNPLLQDSGVVVNGKRLLVNDLFRGVHDALTHAKEGYQFGPRGEYNAFLAHSRMFSDEAIPALASETMAQNSWVNFGRHLRRPDGSLPVRGDKDFVPAPQRPFADQKSVVLDPGLIREALAPVEQAGSYMPLTEAGKELQSRGLVFDDSESGSGTYFLKIRRPGDPLSDRLSGGKGEVIASLSAAVNGPNSAKVGMITVSPELRGTGLSDTLYRELGARLQRDGITQLEGDVISPKPVIAARERVFGTPEKLEFAGRDLGLGEIVPTAKITSRVDPEAKFMPTAEEYEARRAARLAQPAKPMVARKADGPKRPEPGQPQLVRRPVLPDSVGDKDLRLIHYSGKAGDLPVLDPKAFGSSAATPADRRGLPKTYFFVEGSRTQADRPLTAGKPYGVRVHGGGIYDLTTNGDPLGWLDMVNREKADRTLIDAGYTGLRVKSQGRDVVALFEATAPTPLGPAGRETTATARAPKDAPQFMPSDSDYLGVVQRGDMATAQRMVDEAARKAGYGDPAIFGNRETAQSYEGRRVELERMRNVADANIAAARKRLSDPSTSSRIADIAARSVARETERVERINAELGMRPAVKLYHGRNSKWNEYIRRGSRSIWATDSLDVAETYGGDVVSLFMRLSNPLVYDAEGGSFRDLVFEGKRLDADDLSAIAEERGYDGLVIRNFFDSNTDDGGSVMSDHFTVFNPAQIKSADPVTYDDAGNPTPLSRRFQPNNSDIRFMPAPQVDTPEFKNWFGESKVVNDDGTPLVVYHGTPNIFSEFKSGSPEGFWGGGFYFTDTARDASRNYASLEGPDLKNKIERLAERYASDENMSPARALKRATSELTEHEGAIMPVFAKLENPLELGTDKEPRWYLDYEGEDSEPSGPLVEFDNAVRSVLSDFDDTDPGGLPDVYELDGSKADKILEAYRNSEGLAYAMDDAGNLVSGEILRRALQLAGYDGIVDARVSERFPTMMRNLSNVTHYVAFEPTQIKSAIGNTGAFDPGNPDIRFMPDARDDKQASNRNEWSKRLFGLPYDSLFPGQRADVDARVEASRKGRPAATVNNPQIRTPEFKAWFGDWEDPKAFTSRASGPVSVVVDRDGLPLPVYHGTNKSFNAFETGRPTANDYGILGPVETERHAVFFSDSPSQAGSYASRGGERLVPVYLDIKQPIDFTKGNLDYVAEDLGVSYRYLTGALPWEFFDGPEGKEFVAKAKAAGYDGAIFEEDALPNSGAVPGRVFAVFEPTQIKSAIGNTGAFDPGNPDIRFMPTAKEADAAGFNSPEVFRGSALVGKPLPVTGKPIFFTDKKVLAEKYARGGELHSAKLRMDNPLRVDAGNNDWLEIPVPEELGPENFRGGVASIESLAEHAKKAGHDSLIVENVVDQWGDGTQFVVFSPEQVALLGSPNRVFMPAGNELFDTSNIQQKAAKKKQQRLSETYPEALKPDFRRDDDGNFVLDEKGKPKAAAIEYDLPETPLAREARKGLRKESEREAAVVKAFADRAEKHLADAKKRPEVAAGAEWYSRFREKISKLIPNDADRTLFAHLLGASSARTPVADNYKQSVEAFNKYKAGDYQRHIDGYLEGLELYESGELAKRYADSGAKPTQSKTRLLDWWIKNNGAEEGKRLLASGELAKRYVAAGNKASTDSRTLLGWWQKQTDLTPLKDNGKGYNANSRAVLRALAGTWLAETKGPKTPNFAGNLAGTTFEATIDVWAARFLHRIGNEGNTKRWRILPVNETGVSDRDFYFGQKVFRELSKRTGIQPDSLQAILWFWEKDHWAKQGWTRGEGAEKSDFNSLVDKTEATSEGRLEAKLDESGEEPDLFGTIEPRKK